MANENYSYKKKQKEMATKKRQEEKKRNKLNKKNMKADRDTTQSTPDSAPAAQ